MSSSELKIHDYSQRIKVLQREQLRKQDEAVLSERSDMRKKLRKVQAELDEELREKKEQILWKKR